MGQNQYAFGLTVLFTKVIAAEKRLNLVVYTVDLSTFSLAGRDLVILRQFVRALTRSLCILRSPGRPWGAARFPQQSFCLFAFWGMNLEMLFQEKAEVCRDLQLFPALQLITNTAPRKAPGTIFSCPHMHDPFEQLSCIVVALGRPPNASARKQRCRVPERARAECTIRSLYAYPPTTSLDAQPLSFYINRRSCVDKRWARA